MRRLLAVSRLLLLSVVIALGIGLLVAKQLVESRTTIWRNVQATNTNLLFSISFLLENTLGSADRSIQQTLRILNELQPSDAPQALAYTRLFRSVQNRNIGLQLVLDEHGRVMHSSQPMGSAFQAFPDRHYFKVHQEDPNIGLFISPPFMSRRDGEASIALSRRWNKADGSFGGVVVSTVKLNMLLELFSTIDLGADGAMNLFLYDGTILMRFPDSANTVGRSLAGTANFERFVKEKSGSFVGVAVLDDVERLYTFRSLDDYPLLVNIARSTDAISADWRREAVLLGAATLVLMLGCLALAGLAEHELRSHRRTAKRLRRAENDMRTIMDSLPALVGYWDSALCNRFANRAHEEWFGMKRAELHGKHIRDVIGPTRYRQIKPHIDLARNGKIQVFESRFKVFNGETRHTVTTCIPEIDRTEDVVGFFVLINDITDRKRAEETIAREKERFHVTLESIKDGVITTDHAGRITYQNPAASALTEWPPSEAQDQWVDAVVQLEASGKRYDRSVHIVYEALARHTVVKLTGDHVLLTRGGKRTPVDASAAPLLGAHGQLNGAVIVFQDATHARAAAQHMQYLAQHDALTALPNRRLLSDLANQALRRAQRKNEQLALLYMDLDGFKRVNDTLGHAAGDELLRAIAQRFSAVIRAGDILARNGGDEFVVLMTAIGSRDDAAQLARRIHDSSSPPVTVAGQMLAIGVSVGISVFPDDAQTFDELMAHADQAMYQSKRRGRNQCSFYDASELNV